MTTPIATWSGSSEAATDAQISKWECLFERDNNWSDDIVSALIARIRLLEAQTAPAEVVGEPTMLPDHARFELTHGEMLLSDDGPWVRYVEFITALKVQEDNYLGWLKIARETIEKLETSTPTQAEAKEAEITVAYLEGYEDGEVGKFNAEDAWHLSETRARLRALLTKGEAR